MINQRAMCFLGAVVLITCTHCSAVAPSATPAPSTPATSITTPAARPTTTLVVDSTHVITLEETLVVTPTKSLTVTASLTPTETLVPETPAPEPLTPETLTPTITVTVSQPMSQTENAPIDNNGAPNPLVEQAINDLAQRTSSAASDIEVVSVEAVVWPDKGMGCPRPGMVYPQVQVDGLLIHLRVGGVLYAYHSGEGRAPFLCEAPSS